LKTPLHSIMGAAELLETGLVKPGDEAEFYKRIRTEASRLLALIEDVIDLSRMDEGESFPTEQVDLREVAVEIAAQLEPAAEKRGISLSVEGGPAVMTGVRRLLWEIVWNLADNAIKYGRDGGEATIYTEQLPDGGARLRVKDNGVGIAPEHQTRVFERFYRVDKSHSRATGGTGLGLSIVKHAAQYHHGQIGLESSDKGTEITVTFPKE
ncbi:MAG: sensor histidine kinase, partial [Candidatus Scatomorpha sp.]